MTNPATITSLSDCRAQIDAVKAKKDELDKKLTAQGKVVNSVLYHGLVGCAVFILAGGLPLLQAAGYLPQISAAMLEIAQKVMIVIAGVVIAFDAYLFWTGSDLRVKQREYQNELKALRDRKHVLQDESSSRWWNNSVAGFLVATISAVFVARNYLGSA